MIPELLMVFLKKISLFFWQGKPNWSAIPLARTRVRALRTIKIRLQAKNPDSILFYRGEKFRHLPKRDKG